MIQSDDDDLISDEDVIAVFPCLDINNIYKQTDKYLVSRQSDWWCHNSGFTNKEEKPRIQINIKLNFLTFL